MEANGFTVANLGGINFGANNSSLIGSTLLLGNTASAFPKQVRITQNENVGYLQVGNVSETGGFFRVSKFNSTDSALTVDTTNRRVGVALGTGTPGNSLDVSGNASVTGNVQAGNVVAEGDLRAGNLKSVWVGSVEIVNNSGSPAGAQVQGAWAVNGTLSATTGSITGNVEAANVRANTNVVVNNINMRNFNNRLFVDAPIQTDGVVITSADFQAFSGVGVQFNDADNSHSTKIRAKPVTDANVTYYLPGNDGSNAQVLTTDGAGNLSWSTVSGGGGTPGGSDSQIQYNDGGSFGGQTYFALNDTTGNIAIGNLGITANTANSTTAVYQNWITAPPHLGNTTTAASYQQGRYLFGSGLGGTAGSGGTGDFSAAVSIFNNMNNARVVVADRYTLTDTGIRNSSLYLNQIVDLSGNIGTSNSNTRLTSLSSDIIIGGADSLNASPDTIRAINCGITVGNNGNSNPGNANVASMTSFNAFTDVRSGSTVTNGIGFKYNPQLQSGATMTNAYAISPATGSPGLTNWATVHMQNNSGNAWGMWGFDGALPDNYWFLLNQDTRSKSRVGPIESYYDRPYTFATTTGSVDLDWDNGTSQYLAPTGNVTLAFTNALTESNGDLFHTVTLVVEQGATPYTITLPTANATIKYAGGISTVGATANAVVMITSTAANIAGTTTYLTTISPEFS